MSKSRWLTGLGVALAALCILGSWVLVSALLDRQDSALLHQVGTIPVETTETSVGGSEAYVVTLAEMEEIIRVKNQGLEQRYHEPREGQLSMQQAIEAASEGLAYMCDNGVLPGQLAPFAFSELGARLGSWPLEARQDIKDIDPSLGFWTIYMSNEVVTVELLIHAMTGRIWEMYVYTYGDTGFEKVDLWNAIDVFTGHLTGDSGVKTLQIAVDEDKKAKAGATSPYKSSERAGVRFDGYNIAVWAYKVGSTSDSGVDTLVISTVEHYGQ